MTEMTAERAIANRLDFVGLDQRGTGPHHVRRNAGDAASRNRPQPVLRAYRHGAHCSRVFFPEHMQHAKTKQTHHWRAIAAGKMDATYFENANRIGTSMPASGNSSRAGTSAAGLIVERR